jgi:hypothetical protein
MPLYDYEDPNGRIVPRIVPVNERDNQPGLKRVQVPQRIIVLSGCFNPEAQTAGEIMSGYHKLECRQGSRFHSSFTPEQIKRAWAT